VDAVKKLSPHASTEVMTGEIAFVSSIVQPHRRAKLLIKGVSLPRLHARFFLTGAGRFDGIGRARVCVERDGDASGSSSF
jgi:hypothetical protein